MPIVPPDAFAAAFAGLPIERRVSLLAAIWEARGLSVDRDGSRLLLDREDAGEIYRTHFDRSVQYDEAELAPDPGLAGRFAARFGSGIGASPFAVLLDALVASHTRVLRTSSFTMSIDHDGPEHGTSYELAATAEITIQVESSERFLFDRRSHDRRIEGSNETRLELFVDGDRRYARAVDGQEATFDVLDGWVARQDTEQYVQHSARTVERFLAAENTTIVGADESTQPPFRVVATGQPERLPANVSDYTAEAS